MNIKRSIAGKGSRLAAIAAAFTVAPLLAVVGVAHAAFATSSVTLSDPRPSTPSNVTSSYDFLTSGVTVAAIQCVKVKFSINPDGTGGAPTTLSTTSATVNTGATDLLASHTGFSLTGTGTDTLSYSSATPTTPASASDRNFVLDGIVNGSIADDDYYMTVSTFGAADCVTTPRDSTIVGFIYTAGQTVSLTVDGTLSFTVAGIAGTGSNSVNGTNITNGVTTTANTIPFGVLTASANRVAAQDLTVSTNSYVGYTVSTRYTAKPTSNTFTIDDLATHTNAVPGTFSNFGTEAFGYTTEDSSLSTCGGSCNANRFASNKWAPFTTGNAELIYNNAAVANQTTRVGFQAGISAVTEPGAYQTTVIYTATPVY